MADLHQPPTDPMQVILERLSNLETKVNGMFSEQTSDTSGTRWPSPQVTGASNAVTANSVVATQVFIPKRTTVTGLTLISFNALGNARTGLYDKAGNALARRTSNQALAGSGFGALNQIPFDSPYIAPAGTYYMAYVFDNSGGASAIATANSLQGFGWANGSMVLPTFMTGFGGSPGYSGIVTGTTY